MTSEEYEIQEARFKRFMKELTQYEVTEQRKLLMNKFLELYSTFRKNPSHEMKDLVASAAAELIKIDSSFSFDLTRLEVLLWP